jgi:ribonuclease P protein component
MKNFGYPKQEKLKSKKEISLLFEQGKWKSCGNLKIIFLNDSLFHSENQKLGVSVSKRYFKKAVERNRIKRLLRESYRLNKEIYAESFEKNALAMLFWTSQKIPENFKEVEKEFLNLCKSNR